MKRLVGLLTIFGGFALSSCRAYTPTLQDTAMIVRVRNQLLNLADGNLKDTWEYTTQLNELKEQLNQYPNISYVLGEIEQDLRDTITQTQIQAKQDALTQKKSFVAQYATGIKNIQEQDLCSAYYKDLDTISFVNNFPTALTIATRYREAGCKRYLPSNGDGPFQILSKEYGSGQLTTGVFYQSVQDFIDFSRAKRMQYKSKLGVDLTYDSFDYTGLINHAALYNGATITGGVAKPNAPKYVFDGYGNDYSGAVRYGILPKFLKVLQWEIANGN